MMRPARLSGFLRLCLLLLPVFVVAQPIAAGAQEYPSKPITVVLVLAAGTGLDVVARTWGEQLAQSLGRPVVFDNRPGANGIVAIEAKRLRPLAVSSLARFRTFPDVPTFAEASGRADFEAVSWHALVAPAAAPRPVVNRLHAEMGRIVRTPEVQDRMAAIGLIPVESRSIEETQQYITAEAKKWGDFITKLGLAGSQ